MRPNWPENKGEVGRPRKPKSKPAFRNAEERHLFIQKHSGDCWWIQKYLEGNLPQVSN